MKSGWKTSEFWLSTAAVLAGVVMSSGILDDTATEWDNKLVGLLIAALAALGYQASRTVLKTKEAKKTVDEQG